MSAQSASMKKQVKQLAKKLEKKEDIEESLVALFELKASLDLYERYDVRELAKQYITDSDFSKKAVLLRSFLKELRSQRKQNEKNAEAEKEAKENRKRPSSSTVGTVSKKMCIPISCEIFPVNSSTKRTVKKPEPKPVGMNRSPILKEINSGAPLADALIDSSEAMFERSKSQMKMFSGRIKVNEGNSGSYTKPSQILRNCAGISFNKIEPAFNLCSSSQKLDFIKMNNGFAKEVDEVFKEITMIEFDGITKLPSRYDFWYQFYNVLVNVYRKNQDICKMEELATRIANNMKRADNVRKTKVIDIVHAGASRRPTVTQQGALPRTSPVIQKRTSKSTPQWK